MKPVITGVTVSVDFADKEYGNGNGSFANIQARYPEPGKPIEELNDVVDQSLDLYFACWKSLMSSRYATGVIASKDYTSAMEAATKRIEMVRNFLRKKVQENDATT